MSAEEPSKRPLEPYIDVVADVPEGVTLQPSFPFWGTALGVDAVMISTADYLSLLETQRRLEALLAPETKTSLRSPIDRDPEVAQYLAECYGNTLLKDAVAGCRERFGAARTPGRSSIDRFWRRLSRKHQSPR